MKYLLKFGDIHTFKIKKNFFLFSKKFNAVFEINEEQFYYINQECDSFIIDERIENSLNKHGKRDIRY